VVEQASGVRIIGRSPALVRVLDTAARVAGKDVTVLVRGETGTGKELIASLLHVNSARARHRLVVFNSATIPAELAEAQLFGHTKGAFTGAVSAHDGYFVQADGGTLFIDEIGELPLPLQAKLLRVLQEREVQPIGSAQVRKVDVRVVAATHRELAAEVKAGRFRDDLFYRLNVIELRVPPLRERTGDVPLLAREFARKYSERYGLGYVVQLAPELVARLEQQPWPGNVRQLENTIARCIALATTKIVGLGALGSRRTRRT
jgi:two-component system response regulator AtoC